MKIGEFAEKYGLNISTVRYYMDKALLTPGRRNNQYVFSRACMDDMEKILKYKEFGLSLEEIELLFFLEKTSNFKDDTVLDIMSQLLSGKRDQLTSERDKLSAAIERLDEELEKFSEAKRSDATAASYGFPFSFIPYLYCPDCRRPLSLESADISGGKILSGTLHCQCGYRASIEKGVILCEGAAEDTPFKSFKNMETVTGIIDQFSGCYRMLIARTYLWIYHQILEAKEPRNVMTGPFPFNFILRYCRRFSPSVTYVIVDPSLKKISKIQQYLEDCDSQTVFMAGNVSRLPLCRECIDIYIDDFSMTNSIFTYNRSLYSYIAPLIKKGGLAVGIFAGYNETPKSLNNFKADNPDFLPEKMNLGRIKADLEENAMTLTDRKIIGRTTGSEKHFYHNVPGEQITVLGYRAVKQQSSSHQLQNQRIKYTP